MTKQKADELYGRIVRGETNKYFKQLSLPEFIKLSEAIKQKDSDEIARILKPKVKKSYAGFVSVLENNDSYDSEITQIGRELIEVNSERFEIGEIIEDNPELSEVITPPPEIELVKEISVTIRGVEHYRRTKATDYTAREVKFLQRRSDRTGGEVFKEYLEVFGNVRTKSAVTTKFYRVR